MSANTSLAIRIAAIFDNKGLKQADKGIKGLQSSVKKLAGAAGIALGTAAVVKFGKKAAQAFIADEKAASQLAVAVKNLGLAFETPRIEEFISNLSKASGVADDVLRPAMQKLLQTTGSVAKSQELLNQALDISRGSGVEFNTVVEDLTKAYVGQTRGLNKYKLGLTQAELKTAKFSDVQEKLAKQFAGANSAYLETYAGKMDLLTTAAGEAQEIIGKGLIDALMILSGDTTIEGLSASMEELATNTSNVIVEIAKLGKAVANFATDSYGKVDNFADDITDFLDRLTGHEERIAERNRARMGGYPSSALGVFPTYVDPNAAARKKAEQEAAKRAKELAAMQKKTLDLQKKNLALQKASKTLNLDAIGIEAALKGKISETDRLSLQLQKAILDGNATMAEKLAKDLEAAVARNNELRAALLATPKAPNPYADWKVPGLDFGGNTLGSKVPGYTPPSWMTPDMFTPGGGMGPQAYNPPTPKVEVKVEIDGQSVTSAITNVQTNQSLSGSFVNVNRLGRFGNVAVAE